VDSNTAVAVLRLELGVQAEVAELGEDAFEQTKVHAADELGVLLGKPVKRAVAKDRDAVGEHLGFEASAAERFEEARSASLDAGTVAEAMPGLGPDHPALVASRGVDRGCDGGALAAGTVGRFREEPAREFIVSRGEADAELADGSPIHLGGPSRPGTSATAQPLVVDLEKPLVGETIEMVGRDATLEANRVRRLITAHPRALASDVLVERATFGFGQSTEGVKLVALPLGVALRIHRCAPRGNWRRLPPYPGFTLLSIAHGGLT
jgi:hypothetical protein